MGVMYVIWDRQIWSSYRADQGWRPYGGPSAHRGHMHISLSWDGAMGETSLWRAAASVRSSGTSWHRQPTATCRASYRRSNRSPLPGETPTLEPSLTPLPSPSLGGTLEDATDDPLNPWTVEVAIGGGPPRFVTVRWLPSWIGAITLPPFGVLIRRDRDCQGVRRHEEVHWQQYRRHGLPGFYLGYLCEWVRAGFSYERHRWEIEARRISGSR